VLDAARERSLPEHYVEALAAMWAPL
jgi:hypothetical protein